MIDVGGEGDALISEIFKVVAHARGTLFDRAQMIAAARTYMPVSYTHLTLPTNREV